MMASSDSTISRFLYGPDFLGNIDSHRTPGDTAPAAYAARGAEFVDRGSYLVSQPLAISSLSRRPHAAFVAIGMAVREAGVPSPPSFGVVSGYVGHIIDRRAEAGRADHGAVGTSQTAFGDVVPPGVLEVFVQQFLNPIGVKPPDLLRGGSIYPALSFLLCLRR